MNRRRRRVAITALTVLGLIGLGPFHVGAESPEWAELQDSVFFTRGHVLQSVTNNLPEADGIWRLEPDLGELFRIRPLFLTHSTASTQYDYMGDAVFLTTRDDRLIVQGWPYEIHFDAASWRLVNRLPVGGGSVAGWAFQGPQLIDAELAGTGLAAGTYGIARCFVDLLWSYHGGSYRRDCLSITVPGTDTPTIRTNEDMLLFSPDSTRRIEDAIPVFSFDDPLYDGNHQTLSFDPERRGFWRGTNLGAQLYPLEDGSPQSPTFEIDFSDLPFSSSNAYVTALYYHPEQQRLFANVFVDLFEDFDRYHVIFSYDPVTGEAHDFGSIDVGVHRDNVYQPASFTSFGDQPAEYEQIIPIIAEAPGVNGCWWATDLWLYNPSPSSTSVTLTRLTQPGASMEVQIPGHGSVRTDNVLAALGGGPAGDGSAHDALYVRSPYRWNEQVVAAGRMWTADATTGGTFGHAVPAVPAPYGYSNHSVVDTDPEIPFNLGANSNASHLDLDHRVPGRFRHNLGIVNTSDEPVTIGLGWTFKESTITFRESLTDGHKTQYESITVAPRSIEVISFDELFPAEVVEGWVPRIAVFGEKPAIVWMSMVDNLTGDATFVPFTNYFTTAARAPHFGSVPYGRFEDYRLALPVVAHLQGIGGTPWQTDLYGFENPTYADSAYPVPLLFYYPKNGSECAAPIGPEIAAFVEGVLAMPPERWRQTLGVGDEIDSDTIWPLRTIFPDAVRLLPECAEAESTRGGMEVLAGSWFSGYSRTYTTREDGGSYGAMLPLYPPGGLPVQHFAGLEVGVENRINVGFFNGNHENAITHRVSMYNASGELVTRRSLTLEPLASVQREITGFFDLESLEPGPYGLTVLPLDDEDAGVQGRSWAYVSVIDNLTNDPINLW